MHARLSRFPCPRHRRRGRGTISAVVGLGSMLAVLATPSGSSAEATISFAEKRLVVQAAPGQSSPSPVPLTIINAGPRGQWITIAVVDWRDPDGLAISGPSATPTVTTSLVSRRPGGRRPPALGQIRSYEVTLTLPAGMKAGTYGATILALSADGSSATVPLIVVAHTCEIAPVPKGLDPTSVGDYTKKVSLTLFSPLGVGSEDLQIPVRFRAGAPAEGTTVGTLSNGDGDVVAVTRTCGALVVHGIKRAGAYTGTLDLAPGQDGGDLKVTVKDRDPLWMPFFLVLAGVALSLVMGWFAKVRRPRTRLEVALGGLKLQADRLQRTARRLIPPDDGRPWPVARDVYLIYRRDDDPDRCGDENTCGLLTTAAGHATQALMEAESDEERKKWSAEGEEFAKIRGYVDALDPLYELNRATGEVYRKLDKMLYERDHRALQSLPVGSRVKSLLAPRLIETQEELAALQTALKSASAFLADFHDLYDRLLRLEAWAPSDDLKERVGKLRGQLIGPVVDNADYLPILSAETDRLELEIGSAYEEERRKRQQVLKTLERAMAGVQEEDMAALEVALAPEASPMDATAGIMAAVADIRATPPVSERSVRNLQVKIRYQTWAFNVVAGLLAILVTLSTLYAGQDTFGSCADYLALFLTAAGFDAALKLVKNALPALIGRLGGTT